MDRPSGERNRTVHDGMAPDAAYAGRLELKLMGADHDLAIAALDGSTRGRQKKNTASSPLLRHRPDLVSVLLEKPEAASSLHHRWL